MGRPRNKLWSIETTNNVGLHWLFVELAPTKEQAIAKIPEYLRDTAKAESLLGISLLEVDDEEGRTSYKRIEVRVPTES